MTRLKHDLGKDVRPCEYFQLITGTGAAGYVNNVFHSEKLDEFPVFWPSYWVYWACQSTRQSSSLARFVIRSSQLVAVQQTKDLVGSKMQWDNSSAS